MDDRIEREKSFHNTRFAHDPARTSPITSRMFAITKQALNETYRRFEAAAIGKRVLEYGCGQGEVSLIVAQKFRPASVVGIDVSEVAVQQARQKAAELGLERTTFEVMNAERMDFPDGQFDLICGIGILHHLDLDVALKELARVLAPGGTCIFLEPLGHNPAINLYRRLTPNLRTDDEHPLLIKDMDLFHRHFGQVEPVFVNLTTLATLPLVRLPGASSLVRCAAGLDKVLFRWLPLTRRYAWNVVLTFSQPRAAAANVSTRPASVH